MSSRVSYGLADLAAAGEVSVSTVKYYLREGLLPPGRLRSATRADYDEEHLRRLRLLKVLREVGDVRVDRLRELVAALESDAAPLDMLGAGADALLPAADPGATPRPAAHDLLAAVIDHLGWHLDPGSRLTAALLAAIEAVLASEVSAPGDVAEQVLRYARAADAIGAGDIAALDAQEPSVLLAQMVVGQVAYGRLLDVLRRAAEAHHAERRWAPDPHA